MLDMAVSSASIRYNGTYASHITKTEPIKEPLFTQEQIDNAVQLKLDKLPYEEGLKKIWGLETTETAAGDGTVTKTVSGSSHIIGPNFRGTVSFSASVSFDPSSYEAGQLGETVDLMAAAYEAHKYALRDAFSGQGLTEQTDQLTVRYQERKDEAAKSFASMVGGVLEAQGQTGQVKKIYDSVQAIFLSYEAKYQSVAVSSPKGWMKAGLYEGVINLQKFGASVKPDSSKQNGLYTLRELEMTAAGVRGSLNIHA